MAVDYIKLRDADLFKTLSEPLLHELAQHCYAVELAAGDTLFPQNAAGDTFYLLETGQVHIVREYPDGEHVILATEGPYYVIGELSMLVGQPRTGAVVAVSDSTLIALPREGFNRVCESHPELAVEVMNYLGMRLYRMNLLVREFAISNEAARVASVLLLLSGDQDGAVSSEVRIRRVARAAATDADVVDRLLKSWVDEGYITFDGRRLTIHDIAMIQKIAG
jgi:CRP-like cAMP-binding protein